MVGVLYMFGMCEYFACEHGIVELVVVGVHFMLIEGDVVIFCGDQCYVYYNFGCFVVVVYLVIVFMFVGV